MALVLASAVAAAGRSVLLVDAALEPDLLTWSHKGYGTPYLRVRRAADEKQMGALAAEARRRGVCVIIDTGRQPGMIAAGALIADRLIIPVRLSPLPALAAISTDAMLTDAATDWTAPLRRFLVATAIVPIPSRVARAVEAIVASTATPRLPVGLGLRAAYEAPFLGGATLFDLVDEEAPGLFRARQEALSLAAAVGLLDRFEQRAFQSRLAPQASS